MNSSQAKSPALMAFLARIAPVRQRITKIILFGSRARAHALPGSDYDVLLVVDHRDRTLRTAIFDAVVAIELEFQAVISPKLMEQADFDRLSAMPTPFLRNVLSEGIALDQAA